MLFKYCMYVCMYVFVLPSYKSLKYNKKSGNVRDYIIR